MFVCLPICHKELVQARELLQWTSELSAPTHHELLILVSSMVAQSDLVEFTKLGKNAFVKVTGIKQRDKREGDWPGPHNVMFRIAAEWMKDNGKGPWLWWECDSIPMNPDWLDILEVEYQKAGKPFMGTIYELPKKHINGVAVYPQNLAAINPYMMAGHATWPFDIIREDITLKRAHNTPLIQRSLADPAKNLPHTFPNRDSLKQIRDGVVLFHGCKDSTLIQRLRETHGINGYERKVEKPKLTSKFRAMLQPRSYYHSGNLGDVIYALPAIKLHGAGELVIGPEQLGTPPCTNPIKRDSFDMLEPLLRSQPYVPKLTFSLEHPHARVVQDLNRFRTTFDKVGRHLTKAHCHLLGVQDKFKEDEPWLSIPDPVWTGRMIVHRSARYRAHNFPWRMLVQRYSKEMLFVGLPAEHQEFEQAFGTKVSFYQSRDFLDLAKVIAGGSCFIGNQSFPLALAIGMGQRVYVETYLPHPDCYFARTNYVDQRSTNVEQFARWLNGQWENSAGHAKPISKEIVTIRRTGSIGDVLAATGIINTLVEQDYEVVWQAAAPMHPLLRRNTKIKAFETPDVGPCDVDLDGAYEKDPDRCTKHFAEIFTRETNKQLLGREISIPKLMNYAPRLKSDETVLRRAVGRLEAHPRPWTMICPRSNSFVNRSVPNDIWEAAARDIEGTKFWLGNTPPPQGIVDLACREIDLLIEYIAAADLLISVDTGPLHIGAAVGTPCVAINQSSSPMVHLSDQRDWVMIEPPNLDCLNCQLNECPINPKEPPCCLVPTERIVWAANNRLRAVTNSDVSAVIALYKPDVNKVNRALECVISQVQEVIIVCDLDTPWPIKGLVTDPKIRVVRKEAKETGYGRKANFGARHSNNKFILFLNDDCYLNPDVVQKCLVQMKDDVGIVSHLLLYPNGTVQYGGKARQAGSMGFGHVNHKQRRCAFTKPVEQESVCGASILVRREAFYAAGGFDERYRLTSEDDHLAMSIRQQGWKVIFTPDAIGIHEEHQSVNKTANFDQMHREASVLFARFWEWYFRKNPNPQEIGRF